MLFVCVFGLSIQSLLQNLTGCLFVGPRADAGQREAGQPLEQPRRQQCGAVIPLLFVLFVFKKNHPQKNHRISRAGNGKVSLSEVEAFVKGKFPLLSSKPALMRAYKHTLSRAGGGDGDDWVVRSLVAVVVVVGV